MWRRKPVIAACTTLKAHAWFNGRCKMIATYNTCDTKCIVLVYERLLHQSSVAFEWPDAVFSRAPRGHSPDICRQAPRPRPDFPLRPCAHRVRNLLALVSLFLILSLDRSSVTVRQSFASFTCQRTRRPAGGSRPRGLRAPARLPTLPAASLCRVPLPIMLITIASYSLGMCLSDTAWRCRCAVYKQGP